MIRAVEDENNLQQLFCNYQYFSPINLANSILAQHN
jgi:hypothetical protein